MKPEDASGTEPERPLHLSRRERGNDNCFYTVLADKMKEGTSKSAVSMFYHWAERYGTPLYVYDVALIRERARKFQKAFKEAGLKAQVGVCKQGVFIGCHDSACRTRGAVSGCGIGRAFTAIKAGFPAERIHFHGNNKSPEELAMALGASNRLHRAR